MNGLTINKVCSCLVVVVIATTASHAAAQYYDNPGKQLGGKRPLNQLPPIVTSDQAAVGQGLFVPPDVKNLPPIVSPSGVGKSPFVYGRNQSTSGSPSSSQNATPLAPVTTQSLPSIIQAPNANALPPITTPVSSRPAAAINRPLPVTPSPKPFSLAPVSNSRPAAVQDGSSNRNPNPFQQGSGSRALAPAGDVFSPAQGADPSFSEVPEFSGPQFETPTVIEPGSVAAPSAIQSIPQNIPQSIPRNVPQSVPFEGSATRSVPGTNNFFAQPQQQASTTAGCPTCGPTGCYDPANVQQQNGCCGSVSSAGYYAFFDVLFWGRGDGDVQLSNSFGLDDFDFVGGGRVTIGMRDDATSGRELTYFGTADLDEGETATSAAGNLQSLFVNGAGITAGQISGFQNAFSQNQSKETQLQSIEFNKVNWGFDLLKTFYGARYIYFDDSFEFFSQSTSGDNGLFTQSSVNNLFGVDGGFELFYDVGYRTSASFQTKVGGYVNAASVDTNLFNAGVQQLERDEDDTSVASTLEFNLTGHLQMSPRSRFRLGYDVLLAWGLFTVENNIPRDTFSDGIQTGIPVISAATGEDLNTNDDTVVFHGVSFGFEVFR